MIPRARLACAGRDQGVPLFRQLMGEWGELGEGRPPPAAPTPPATPGATEVPDEREEDDV